MAKPALTFWQANEKAAWLALQSVVWAIPLIVIGGIAGHLLVNGNNVLLVLFLIGALPVALGLQARSIQRWNRSP